MARKRVNVISLGCSKNLVDTERLMSMLCEAGFDTLFEQPVSQGPFDHVVINTCGFIGDAKEESINTILEWIEAKRSGQVGTLRVMGCLSQRYAQELPAEIPEVDAWYGKLNWAKIVADIAPEAVVEPSSSRQLTTPQHHAYLKIAEGCNRFCAFCAIPLITGRFTSRPIEDIVIEVKELVAKGVKELNVIAQELTSYGVDLYGHRALGELIDAIAAVDGVEWIRLHYAYPADFPDDLLDAMARNPKVCRYIDIALQHISDNVLSNMRRHIDSAQTRKLLQRIRSRVPGIHIRTTLMVGFPGEGDKEFAELMDFVREQRFERMGAFAYCEEEDTYAARNFSDDIPEEVKKNRLDSLMELQEEIALEHQQAKVGSVMKVMIDREEEDYYVGRTEFDSPDVDPEVLVEKSVALAPGEFCNVKIIEAMPFELIGQVTE
ncbi:MAG: 30S ribosomal protein S12 methylthiotransferase RimO [Firmicutes bacterium]|nr:30S ribosomal protein S12 methylthiotransferase RimO [Bacillota bacterium]MCM1402010.1 30S ribosomal protein S12 methylthiotransferase RimO [Bacteroides sp.]MCM1477932.1 30S ribosomal protein S12 methylthiotransferase RimO [Bacteroides sp.]